MRLLILLFAACLAVGSCSSSTDSASSSTPDLVQANPELPPRSASDVAFRRCQGTIRLFARHPSSARIPEIDGIALQDKLFVFDWTRNSGLAFQNSMGAMLDTTASCVVVGGAVVSLVLDHELITDSQLHKMERQGGLPSVPTSEVNILDPRLPVGAWDGIEEIWNALEEARARTFAFRNTYYNDSTNGWATQAFFVGPITISTALETDEFECEPAHRATARFDFYTSQSKFFETKDAATEADGSTTNNIFDWKIRINYCYSSGKWMYVNGKYYLSPSDEGFEIEINDTTHVPNSGLAAFTSIKEPAG